MFRIFFVFCCFLMTMNVSAADAATRQLDPRKPISFGLEPNTSIDFTVQLQRNRHYTFVLNHNNSSNRPARGQFRGGPSPQSSGFVPTKLKGLVVLDAYSEGVAGARTFRVINATKKRTTFKLELYLDDVHQEWSSSSYALYNRLEVPANGKYSARVDFAGDRDTWPIRVRAGRTYRIEVTGAAGLAPTAEIFGNPSIDAKGYRVSGRTAGSTATLVAKAKKDGWAHVTVGAANVSKTGNYGWTIR